MKKIFLITLVIISAFAFSAFAQDDHKMDHGKEMATTEEPAYNGNQTKCPIMGGDINKEVYSDFGNKRVFYCCAGCDSKFAEDLEANLKAMADSGIEVMTLAKQSVCPVSGKELANNDTFTDVEGKRVYVCCEGCQAKVAADAAKFIKVIADRGEFLELAAK
jgi:hypothetical protein